MPQIIKIKVFPRAKENKILGFKDDVLRVRVAAPPVGGKANKALIKFLSEEFGIAKSEIKIARGGASRQKILEIPDGIAALQNTLI